MLTVIMQTHQEALVLRALNMYKVTCLYPEVSKISAVEWYMMELVHQIAPEDGAT